MNNNASVQNNIIDSNDEQPVIVPIDNRLFFKMGNFVENDIFVCGWPKSGNTWMQRICVCLYFGVDPEMTTDQLGQSLQPDVHANKYYKRFITPMLFKSHFPPQKNYRRVIHLVRDGRDACLSYWHMLKKNNPEISLESIFLSDAKTFALSWAEHSREWIKNPYSADKIVVRYEDLIDNPIEVLQQVSSFLGVDRSVSQMQHIVDKLSIDKMRTMSYQHGWHGESPMLNDFFRRGKKKSYVDEVPSEIINKFENKYMDILKYFKYK
jgi:hypothetical protein